MVIVGTPGEVPSARTTEKVVATRQDVYAGQQLAAIYTMTDPCAFGIDKIYVSTLKTSYSGLLFDAFSLGGKQLQTKCAFP